jgi:hypothetical protein
MASGTTSQPAAAPETGGHRPGGRLALVLKVLLLLVIVAYLALIPLGLIGAENRLGLPELVLVAALLLSIPDVVANLAKISVSATGFSAEFQSRLTSVEASVHTLQLIVDGLVSEWERGLLLGLARPEPFMVEFHNHMVVELYRLDALGYVKPNLDAGIEAIRAHDGGKPAFNLHQYVRITAQGLKYLELRDELARSTRRA